MDPVLTAILRSWDWRIDVIIVLALVGTLYSRGWWLLRQRSMSARPQRKAQLKIKRRRLRLAAPIRLVSYWTGLLLIALALLSPIDIMAQQLFMMHMIQHLLLIMFAPPLLLLANPLPFMLWGLPAALRYRMGDLLSVALHRNSRFRHAVRKVTAPGVIWLVWVVSVIGWHDPAMYNAALRVEWVHDVEHLTFFLAGMLFWWHITGAGPRLHRQGSLASRIALTIAAVPPNMITGVVLAFSRKPVYTYYEAVPRIWGISVMTDQQLGGIIMWIPGSMMFIIAAIILMSRLVDDRPPRTITRQPSLVNNTP